LGLSKTRSPSFATALEFYERCEGKWIRARENFVKFVEAFRSDAKRRRDREVAGRRLHLERVDDSGDVIALSEKYWKRQAQRFDVLFGEFQRFIGSGYGFAESKASGVFKRVLGKYSAAKDSFRARVLPATTRIRARVRANALPLAEVLVRRFPQHTSAVVVGVAFGSRRLGGAGSEDWETFSSGNHLEDFSAVLGDLFLLAAGGVVVLSILYFVAFRSRPGDALPDEAEYRVKHVPANDGTFLGAAVGGGLDAFIKLPEVKRAAECDILVSEDAIKVKALAEDYHDVTVAIPPEAKGRHWKPSVDAWIMRATFDLKSETLKISLRTPASVVAKSAASPLGGGAAAAASGKENGGNGSSANTARVGSPAPKPTPFSPVTPNRSVAERMAAEAVKAATSARKKKK
jgi:hypothetical protein